MAESDHTGTCECRFCQLAGLIDTALQREIDPFVQADVIGQALAQIVMANGVDAAAIMASFANGMSNAFIEMNVDEDDREDVKRLLNTSAASRAIN